jgi:hypothetical protein
MFGGGFFFDIRDVGIQPTLHFPATVFIVLPQNKRARLRIPSYKIT